MNNLTDFDTSKYRLGSLCKRGHNWKDTGQSLRVQGSYSCVECRRLALLTPESKAKQAEYRRLNADTIRTKKKQYHQENKEKLCKKSADWYHNNIERAREYHKEYNKQNAESIRLRRQRLRLENPEKFKEKSRKAYWKNREKNIQAIRKYRHKNREILRAKKRKFRQDNLDAVRKYDREYRLKNIEKINTFAAASRKRNALKIKERDRLYKQTEHGRLIRQIAHRRRRLKKTTNHKSPYTSEQIKLLYKKFDNTCAWCKNISPLQLDHFLPISRGGSDCLGNIVPACGSCNSSKQDNNPKEWYSRQSFYSITRWRHILKVLGKTESNYLVIPLL